MQIVKHPHVSRLNLLIVFFTVLLSRFQLIDASRDSFAWNIDLETPGYLKDPPIQDGILEFITGYNISDRHYEIEVFQTDCVTPSNGLPLSTTIDSKAEGLNHFEASFMYNQSIVQVSNIWTANLTGGNVQFCLKVGLYSNQTDGILFNFHETIYQIEVDTLAGFSMAVEVKTMTSARNNGLLELIPARFEDSYFIARYQVLDRDCYFEVYKNDCATPVTPSNALPLHSTNTSIIDGIKDVEARFFYNQTIIESSNLWNSTGGYVHFCLSLVLNTPINAGRRTNDLNERALRETGFFNNFIDTTYRIVINLTDFYQSPINLQSTETSNLGNLRINYDENVIVYQCNDSFDELTSITHLTQGDSLQICIETADGSAFEVGDVQDVIVSQNGTKPFNYVESYQDSYWSSTSCIATTAFKCKVKMQLIGAYFTDDNPADLTVSGVVKMDYLGSRRLHLVNEEKDGAAMINMRDLQQSIISAGSGGTFSINVALATNDEDTAFNPDSNTDEKNSGSLSMRSILLTVMVTFMLVVVL